MATPEKVDGIPLGQLNFWVTRPSVISGLVGFLFALVYGYATIRFPEGTLRPLFVVCFGVVIVANFLGNRSEQQRLKITTAISLGAVPRDTRHLGLAASELARLPETSFFINLGYWCSGAAMMALLWTLYTRVDLALGLRVAFIGLVCGPASSVLAYLSVLIRSRRAITALASLGLTARELYDALPPPRQVLSRRLFFFAAVTVLTPLIFVIDASIDHLDHVLDAALVSADATSAAAAFVAVDRANMFGLLSGSVLVIALTATSAWWGGSALGGPLVALADQTRAFAEGHLDQSRVVPAEDEVWAAGVAFGGMATQLDQTVGRLADAGIKLGTTVEELQASGTKHTAGGTEQKAALTHTSTTTEELARSARQVSANASQVADLASRTVAAAQVGKKSADAFYASIVQVREGNQTVADSVVKLNKRVQQVGRIVEFIDGIADRSDLLALNAELEGTKAGEVGRGFSLVAAEMRRLSESVMTSTREISRLIEEIRDATNAAVMATEAGVKATDVGKSLAQKVSASFDSILQYANLTSDAVKAISLATQQQQAGTDQLAQAMGEILKSTDEGASTSSQMLSANGDLAALARELKAAVERVGAR
jgi:methyl-accepting chemotaxis protein